MMWGTPWRSRDPLWRVLDPLNWRMFNPGMKEDTIKLKNMYVRYLLFSLSIVSLAETGAQNLRQDIVMKTSFRTRVSRMGLGSFVNILHCFESLKSKSTKTKTKKETREFRSMILVYISGSGTPFQTKPDFKVNKERPEMILNLPSHNLINPIFGYWLDKNSFLSLTNSTVKIGKKFICIPRRLTRELAVNL